MSTTKRITKRLLAVVLTVMMLMSMVTIGMTSASAAKVDLAPTGYDIAANTKFYFDNSEALLSSSWLVIADGHRVTRCPRLLILTFITLICLPGAVSTIWQYLV